MSGRHKFSELETSMTPQRRARIGRLAEKLEERIELESTNATVAQRKAKSTSCSTATSGKEKEKQER